MAHAAVVRRRHDPGRVGATDRMYPPHANHAAPYVSPELSHPARRVPPVQHGSTSVLDSADLRRAETENLIFTSAAASAGTPDDATAAKVEGLVRELNPSAKVLRTVRGEVPLDERLAGLLLKGLAPGPRGYPGRRPGSTSTG